MSLRPRSSSISLASESSQTAADFIKEQLILEAEAREALPYQFDKCTRDLGALRQSLYACLTCNLPPKTPDDPYNSAAVCYSCSISCHGEHTLVELFNKRDFICDCGTTRIPEETPCTLRINSATGQKGGVHGEEPAETNKYDQNFRNKFCGCGEEYDADQEKGTMFQCLGLGSCEDGGCGEDWWHPECLVGMTREEYRKLIEESKKQKKTITNGVDGNDVAAGVEVEEDDDDPLPPGFPDEDDFDHFLCYKCVTSHPWIKKYAGSTGFLNPVYSSKELNEVRNGDDVTQPSLHTNGNYSKKRKASEEAEDQITTASLVVPGSAKRQKSEDPSSVFSAIPETTMSLSGIQTKYTDPVTPLHTLLAPPSSTVQNQSFSLFLKPGFREHLCRCPSCFGDLKAHPQLLEEEDTYEPPVSEDGKDGAQSVGTGSLLDRGEAAFNNMDRVRAIQGAMAYAQLKDKVSAFLKPFAESGQAVGAEDVKAYFEKLRGDAPGIQEAAGGAKASRREDEGGDGGAGGAGGNNRKEQSGY